LIGGSLALALRKRRPDWKLKLWARSPASVQRTREFFPDATSEIAAAVEGADLCVLCTPISAMADLAEKIVPHLSADAAVTDAGSVKSGVVQRLEHILGERFVGSHPMAGSEKSGLEAAQEDLFEGAACILTPTPRSLPSALTAIRQLWEIVGCRVVELSAAKHDQAIARVSHLPHAVAAALVNSISQRLPEATALAGGGYRDSTRIAASPSALWREIFLENKDELLAGLEDFSTMIEDLKQLIRSDEDAALEAFLARARETRERLS